MPTNLRPEIERQVREIIDPVWMNPQYRFAVHVVRHLVDLTIERMAATADFCECRDYARELRAMKGSSLQRQAF